MTLESLPFIRSLQQSELFLKDRHDDRGQIAGVSYGVVTDVDDPLSRSRVKVALDGMGGNYQTDWIPVTPSFQGKQPQSLAGQRVKVDFADGDATRGSVTQVIDDDENQESVVTGTGFRLPVYRSGNLPPATEENIGLVAIENGGPLASDWLVVCLRRNGSPLWVRHVDLNHIHSSQDRGLQGPDSAGDKEQPVEEFTVWDEVAPTTHQAYEQQSRTTRGAAWFGGA